MWVHTNSQEKVISLGLTPFCSKHSKLVFLQPHKTRQSKPTSRLPYAPYPRTPLATVLTFCSSGLLPLGFISTHPLRPLGPHLSPFRSHQSDISAIDSLQVPLCVSRWSVWANLQQVMWLEFDRRSSVWNIWSCTQIKMFNVQYKLVNVQYTASVCSGTMLHLDRNVQHTMCNAVFNVWCAMFSAL